jgi:hypothetical protein
VACTADVGVVAAVGAGQLEPMDFKLMVSARQIWCCLV